MNNLFDNIDISILVVTYNPSWDKLKKTIFSILIQKNINFEIVIADDGSKDNCFEKIKEYFSQESFTNYKLVANPQNKGTVKNMISGLEVCSGEYVKDISPGDYLYDENTLFSIVQKIRIDKKELYFGKSIYYSFNEQGFCFYDIGNPRCIEPYIKGNENLIKKNYLLKHDYILGASVVVKTTIYLKYLKKIEQSVIYAEDCAFICMVADGITPVFIDENILWYEYGIGISTSKASIWGKRLYDDNKNTFSRLMEEKKIPKNFFELYFSDNIIKRLFLSCFLNPSLIVNRFVKHKGEKHIANDEVEKLMTILRIK